MRARCGDEKKLMRGPVNGVRGLIPHQLLSAAELAAINDGPLVDQ